MKSMKEYGSKYEGKILKGKEILQAKKQYHRI